MTAARKPDGSRKDYGYDPLGRLVYLKHNQSVRHIVWDGPHPIMELNDQKTPVKTYLYGDSLDFLIGIRTDRPYYVHLDRLGSVRLVTDAQGRLVGRLDYDPFGGPLPSAELPLDALFFAGRPYDNELGCYDLRQRFYSPELKRFLSRDPFAGTPISPATLNPYVYALNNPVNLKDPNGEFLPLVILGGIAVYSIAVGVSFGAGYLAGTVLYEGGKAVNEFSKDPDKYMHEAVDKAKKPVETVLGSNLSSVQGQDTDNIMDNSPSSIEKTPEGFEKVQQGVKNAQEVVESAVDTAYGGGTKSTLVKEVVNQTNPDSKENVKQHYQNVANYLGEGTKELKGEIVKAGTGALQDEFDKTDIGKHVKDIKDTAEELNPLTKVPGGKTVQDTAANVIQSGIDQAGEVANPKPPPKPASSPSQQTAAQEPSPPANVGSVSPPIIPPVIIPGKGTTNDTDIALYTNAIAIAPPEELVPPPPIPLEFTNMFGPGTAPATPPDKGEKPDDSEDLASSEPTAPTGAMAAATGPDKKPVVDDFIDFLTEIALNDTASDYNTMQGNTQIGQASTSGDGQLQGGKDAVNAAGADAQTVKGQTSTEIAQDDNAAGWGATVGNALQQGFEAGDSAFGGVIGTSLASQAGNSMFGKPPSSSSSGSGSGSSSSSGTTGSSGTTSSGSGVSAGSSTQTAGGTSTTPSSGGGSDSTGGSGTSTTPTPQTQTSGSFTAKLVPSGSSYWIEVTGVSSNNLTATVSGTDGYSASFSGMGSLKSSTIPAGASGVNDTVVTKDLNTGETATFNFVF